MNLPPRESAPRGRPRISAGAHRAMSWNPAAGRTAAVRAHTGPAEPGAAGPRAPHGTPVRPQARTLVLSNKESQP